MARNVGSSLTNTFTKGTITEATGLNFPENAVTETLNCVFDSKGPVSRRLGIDFETDYSTDTITRSSYAMKSYLWENAGGNGLNNFVVLQVGPDLSFYRVGSEASLSAGLHATTIDIATYIAPGATDVTDEACEFANGKGYLFVTHPYCNPFYIQYDIDTDALTATEITIKIRDRTGLDDGLEIDENPTTLSDEHKYNLYNQGWEPISTGGSIWRRAGTALVPPLYSDKYGDPLVTWDMNRTDFPSNADVWWLYKDAAGTFQPSDAVINNRGTSPAAKGHYVLEAFYQDRSTVSGIGAFDIVSSGKYRPQATAFFGGRVWYSGPQTQNFNNRIYFSQLVKEDVDLGACHAENDPTVEYDFDILSTDGGTVQILDCGAIFKMVTVFNSLMIFASNGVWSISGSEGIGFTATDYSVAKVSSINALSSSSFISVGGLPIWWNTDGIYTVKPDKLGASEIISLTEATIKTDYVETIPTESKLYARGSFNDLTKVAQWAYRSTQATTEKELYDFDKILCFDVVGQSFYTWTLPSTNGVYLNDITSIRGQGVTTTTGAVEDTNNDTVVDTATGATVTATGTSLTEVSDVFKYIVTYESGGQYYVTMAEEYDTTYKDFTTVDATGVDFSSYFISGFDIKGEADKQFQNPYISIFYERVTDTKFNFQTLWGYTNDPDTGEFTQKQLITMPTDDRKYFKNRLRVRGQGIALQYKVSSYSGKPFRIIGWSPFNTANAQV